MADTRAKIFNEMLKPRLVRIWLGAVAVVGTYDVFSNQFGLWTLRKLIGMSGGLLPASGWSMMFMGGLFYSLFEYVRVSTPLPAHGPAATTNPQKLSFVDDATVRMAGKLQRLGEVIMAPKFSTFREHSTDAYDYRDIMDSSHVIWTRQKPRQLRRDIRNAVQRIGTAAMEHDALERQAAATDLVTAMNPLVKILLGEESPD